jgi:hypothetical protein
MRPSYFALISAIFSALLLGACSKEPAAPAMPPLPVKVMDVIQRDAAISKDLIGEVQARSWCFIGTSGGILMPI